MPPVLAKLNRMSISLHPQAFLAMTGMSKKRRSRKPPSIRPTSSPDRGHRHYRIDALHYAAELGGSGQMSRISHIG
jgi:hypothetical protein